MTTNGHSNDLLDTVQNGILAEWQKADNEGKPRPGRPTLVRELGVSDYYVRKALENQLETSPPPAPASPDLADSVDDAVEPADAAPTASTETPGGHLAPPSTPAGQRFSSHATWIRQRPWALLLMGVAAGFSVWSGWVGLGAMAGFGPVQPLPGIWDSLTINSAIVLPISVEAYGAYALRKWLTPGYSRRTSIYAGISSVASLVVGGAAQVAYHLLKAYGYTRAPWQVVTAVALVPVVVLTLAAILAKLVSVDRQAGHQR